MDHDRGGMEFSDWPGDRGEGRGGRAGQTAFGDVGGFKTEKFEVETSGFGGDGVRDGHGPDAIDDVVVVDDRPRQGVFGVKLPPGPPAVTMIDVEFVEPAPPPPGAAHGAGPGGPGPAAMAHYQPPAVPQGEAGQKARAPEAKPAPGGALPQEQKPRRDGARVVQRREARTAPDVEHADAAAPARMAPVQPAPVRGNERGDGEPAPVVDAAAPVETTKVDVGTAAVAVAAAAAQSVRSVEAALAARGAGAVASIARDLDTAAVERVVAAVGQAAGRVGAVVASVAQIAEAAVADEAASATLVAAGAGEAASGLLYLPSGPAVLLGLAPASLSAGPAAAKPWWRSEQLWRITAAGALLVSIIGYGYCRADAERQRLLARRAARAAAAAPRCQPV